MVGLNTKIGSKNDNRVGLNGWDCIDLAGGGVEWTGLFSWQRGGFLRH